MAFDWNEGNIDKNLVKHSVTNKEAEEIFRNRPLKLFKDIKHSQKEQRFVALGLTNTQRKLNIVFTIREIKIRVISARNMSKKEKELYEKEKS